MEKELDEKQSIQIIREMLDRSRKNIGEGAEYYLMWGWLILIAAIGEYFLLLMEVEQHYYVWPVVTIIGIIGNFVIRYRRQKTEKRTTYLDRALGYLWMGFFILLITMMVWAAMAQMSWSMIYVMIIGMIGITTFISGGMLKYNLLMWGGGLSYLIALVCLFTPLSEQFNFMLLALGICMVLSYLIPGYALKRTR